MLVDGWDLPINPSRVYDSKWSCFLGKRSNMDREERVAQAENIARDNNGVLPSRGRLEKIDKGLVNFMIRYPEAFKHIRQERRHSSIADHLIQAERLSIAHGGYMPPRRWLNKHYPGVYMCVKRHPSVFLHIPRRPSGRHLNHSVT